VTQTLPKSPLHAGRGAVLHYEEPITARDSSTQESYLHSVSLSDCPDSLETVQLDATATVTADIGGYDPQDKILIGVEYGLADSRPERGNL
jgi:hypothetical protein